MFSAIVPADVVKENGQLKQKLKNVDVMKKNLEGEEGFEPELVCFWSFRGQH